MASIKELTDQLIKLDDDLVSCMRCGLCQAACPMYQATLKEADVARGKIALLEYLANEISKDPEGVYDKLHRCLLCSACQSTCPSGVNTQEIFLRARHIMAGYMGLSPVKKIIFRVVLQRPKLFNVLLDIGSKFQGLFIKDANEVVGTSCSTVLKPFIGDRHFKGLAEKSLHKEVPELNTAPGKSGLKVAFFPGCVTDKIYPDVGLDSLKVFNHHGVGVYMPSSQACCGIPALAYGDKDTYEKLLEQNYKLFTAEEFDYLITPCATCTSTIKEVWSKFSDNYHHEKKLKIKEIADKTMDISQFLVDVLKVDAEAVEEKANAESITYHDPCHLNRSLGITAQPRKVLGLNPEYKLTEMAEANRCCGSGGSFTLAHYDLSKDIGQRKRNNIVASKATTVATSCPACMMQMMDVLSRNDDQIKVRHVIEVYADTLQ